MQRSVLLLILFLLALSRPVSARIWYVNASATGSANTGVSWPNAFTALQTAVYNPALSNGDEIWVAKGTYRPLTTGGFEFPGNGNQYALVGGFVGTETKPDQRTLSEANATIISGDYRNTPANPNDNTDRLIISSNSLLRVDGLTIQDGANISSLQSSTLIADNCLIKNNVSANGTGLSPVIGNYVRLTNCQFVDNKAGDKGGAVTATGQLVAVNCEFLRNQALSGGAILFPVLLGTKLLPDTLQNCRFVANQATGQRPTFGVGGAVFIDGFSPQYFDKLPVFLNCLFANNIAASGGAVFVRHMSTTTSPTVRFQHGTFYGNQAGGFANTYFSAINGDNTSGESVPIYIELVNSILWQGERDALFANTTGYPFAPASLAAANYNCVFVGSHSIHPFTPTDRSTFYTNPQFKNPGGLDFTLGPCSPAVNRGRNSGSAGIGTDLAGQPRIAHGRADLGAYEYNGASQPNPANQVYVNGEGALTALNDGSSFANGFSDLQKALSPPCAASQVFLTTGYYYPSPDADRAVSFSLSSGQIVVGGFSGFEAADIDGTRSQPTIYRSILSGNIGNPNSRADNSYHVLRTGRADFAPSLSGVYVEDGQANGSVDDSFGGGLLNSNKGPGTVIVKSIGQPSSQGLNGTMATYASSPALTNVIFRYNQASAGGSAVANLTYNANADVYQAFPVIKNGLFYQNGPSVVYADESLLAPTGRNSIRLINSTFSQNSRPILDRASAGGLFSPTQINLDNGIVWGNLADDPKNPAPLFDGAMTLRSSNTEGGVYSGTATTSVDPKFAGSGGGILNFRLLTTSPLLSAGNTALFPFLNVGTTTSRDLNRDPVLQSGKLALGPFAVGVSAALPLTWLDFRGRAIERGIVLSWDVTNERDNAGFAIERSANLTGFERVGYTSAQTTGASRQTYTFVDNQPIPDLNYYRLRQYDTNGDSDLSRIIGLSYAPTDWLMWGANPSAGPLWIRAGLVMAQVTVYDSRGAVVQQLSPAAAEAEVGAGSWAAGVYLVRVTLDSGSARVIRWVKL